MSTTKDITGIGYKLKYTQHILRIHMDEALRPFALTTPQYAVLSQLELKPGISSAALARASFITPQTMHGIIANLERNDFVQRKRDPHHGRILCTKLTNHGLKVIKQAHKVIQKVENNMTRTINQDTKNLLGKLLIECVNNLNTTDYL